MNHECPAASSPCLSVKSGRLTESIQPEAMVRRAPQRDLMKTYIFEITTSESGLSSTFPPGLLVLLKTTTDDLTFGLTGLARSPARVTLN